MLALSRRLCSLLWVHLCLCYLGPWGFPPSMVSIPRLWKRCNKGRMWGEERGQGELLTLETFPKKRDTPTRGPPLRPLHFYTRKSTLESSFSGSCCTTARHSRESTAVPPVSSALSLQFTTQAPTQPHLQGGGVRSQARTNQEPALVMPLPCTCPSSPLSVQTWAGAGGAWCRGRWEAQVDAGAERIPQGHSVPVSVFLPEH